MFAHAWGDFLFCNVCFQAAQSSTGRGVCSLFCYSDLCSLPVCMTHQLPLPHVTKVWHHPHELMDKYVSWVVLCGFSVHNMQQNAQVALQGSTCVVQAVWATAISSFSVSIRSDKRSSFSVCSNRIANTWAHLNLSSAHCPQSHLEEILDENNGK